MATKISVLEFVKPKAIGEGNAVRVWSSTKQIHSDVKKLTGSDMKLTEMIHLALLRLKAEVEEAEA